MLVTSSKNDLELGSSPNFALDTVQHKSKSHPKLGFPPGFKLF